MLKRACVGVVLTGSAVFLAGCGNGAAPDNKATPPGKQAEAAPAPQAKAPPPAKKAVPAPVGTQTVKLHVKDMTERLKLV